MADRVHGDELRVGDTVRVLQWRRIVSLEPYTVPPGVLHPAAREDHPDGLNGQIAHFATTETGMTITPKGLYEVREDAR